VAASRRPEPGRRGAARTVTRGGTRVQRRSAVPEHPASPRVVPAGRATPTKATRRTDPARTGATGLTTRAAVLGLVVCAMVVSAALPLREYLAQRGAIAKAVATQRTQEQQVRALEAEKQRLQDPAYIASEARRRLHFVLPGETAYILVPPSAGPAPRRSRDARAELPAGPEAPWYSQLYDSVRAADSPAPGG